MGDIAAGGPTQEREWIRQIAKGDRAAFERLYAVFGRRIFRYVVRMVRDEGKAEEVTSDVMFEVWKGAGRFEGRSAPSTWILGIARNRALNAMRGKRIATTDIDEAIGLADSREGADEAADRMVWEHRVREALDELSVEHREVVELTFFHGHSYKEIAEIVGCPENTVKTRMFHAKKRLAPVLQAAGLSPGDGS